MKPDTPTVPLSKKEIAALKAIERFCDATSWVDLHTGDP